ncbi:hypothetical protein C7460_1268 [Marinoscillum furvescens DSM 4134]|uniref:Uncharacterized protein n=1 Tax=Marinoscillum furvescens DSM 4134 TaxID=1122208 RepID=A0A3D9KY24_MARFU|nr:hypothetical protein C7460_1268 [Marinoscillum furvescens DSM 4134]
MMAGIAKIAEVRHKHNSFQVALRSESEKPCELKSVESTDLSQRLIHGEARPEASKEAVRRIHSSDCWYSF